MKRPFKSSDVHCESYIFLKHWKLETQISQPPTISIVTKTFKNLNGIAI